MTDRELLGLAAKAAGIKYTVHQVGYDHYALYIPEERDWWMPLADDGDALRLACALELSVYINKQMINVTHSMKPFCELEIIEDDTTDIYAATRRAIVRSAAEIGKEMP